jgi:ankyrin repeat protein
MAPKRGKENPLELCTKATLLGNSISVRMLEYLSTAKHYPHGFRELSTEFLDICRIMWSIEAGLTEANRRHTQGQFPADMIQELEKKFRSINDDFIVLNQTLLKFLDYESKSGIGRLSKGWHMMFADTTIEKIRASLAKNREALKMSSVVFRWSLGDAKADASAGIGYTGLIAALERMGGTQSTVIQQPLPPPPMEEPEDVPHELVREFTRELPPQLPPVSLMDRGSASNLMPSEELLASPPPITDRQGYRGASSIRSRDSVLRRTPNTHEDSLSEGTSGSKTVYEDQTSEMESKFPVEVIRLKADPNTVPRWTPRQTSGANSAGLKAALINGIQQKKHKTIEHLLDSGVLIDSGLDAGLLKRACFNRDAESIRLLLLFGADPNSSDNEGLTPLFAATRENFLEGARMLIKYGAEPNLSAGPDDETPLALAVGEGKFEFVQLYLMYGGDASAVMADGNTAFIKAMAKSTPIRLVELMLNYDTDPNAKNGEGQTALFCAINCRRIDLVNLLLDHGADPNLPGPKHILWPAVHQPRILELLLAHGATPTKTPGIMELAASIKCLDTISILLKAGVSPNIKKDGIYTPLCSAIRDNSVEVVDLLLANGADPNLAAAEYPTFKCVTHHHPQLLPKLVAAGANLREPKGILETAVKHNSLDALTYLLKQGVNPNDRNADGCTALTTAIREDRGEFVDLLLANGADPSVRGEDWPICMAVKRPAILRKLLPRVQNPRAVRGVIEMAVVANQLESVKLLLAAGISVEDKNGGVFSPLTTAIREIHPEIVRFLLTEGGADPNSPGEHLPIIKALRRLQPGHPEIIEMLLDAGADINLMYRGWNAVLQAVENGDSKILALLVKKGGPADLQAKDESGRPVIDIVTERGWDEAVTILVGERSSSRKKP